MRWHRRPCAPEALSKGVFFYLTREGGFVILHKYFAAWHLLFALGRIYMLGGQIKRTCIIEKKGNGAHLGFENQLWAAADQLEATIRRNLEVLGYGG